MSSLPNVTKASSEALEMDEIRVLAGNRSAQAHDTAAGGGPPVVMEEQLGIVGSPLARHGFYKGAVGASVSDNQLAALAAQRRMNS